MIVRELLAKLGLQVDGSGFSKAESAFKSLGSAVRKIGGFALAAKAALLAVVDSTANQAREVENTARVTGMSADQVQQLGYAAKATGVSSEELQHGLVHLARSAQEVALGSGEAAAGFFRLGISAVDANGKALPISQLLAQVAAKFQTMPDGTEKAAAAMQIFGRAGAELIPFLDKGPTGIAALSAEATRLGVVMGSGTLAGAARYREAMRQMAGAIEGVKIAISDRLFPAFTRSAQQFGAWILAHRQWLALKVEQSFNAVSAVLQSLVRIGGSAVTLFERIWTSGAAGKAALVALGAAVAAVVAPWMSLVTVLALVADDVEGYFDGRNSITGRIVEAFKRLGAEMQKGDWLGDMIDKMMLRLTAFFDWVVDQFHSLPGRLAGGSSVPDAGVVEWLKSLSPFGKSQTNREDYLDDRFSPGPAFKGVPGGQFAYPQIDGKYYQVDSKTGAGSGTGPAFSVSVGSINLTGSSTDDPEAFAKQLAQKLGPLVRSEILENQQKQLREANAGVNR